MWDNRQRSSQEATYYVKCQNNNEDENQSTEGRRWWGSAQLSKSSLLSEIYCESNFLSEQIRAGLSILISTVFTNFRIHHLIQPKPTRGVDGEKWSLRLILHSWKIYPWDMHSYKILQRQTQVACSNLGYQKPQSLHSMYIFYSTFFQSTKISSLMVLFTLAGI